MANRQGIDKLRQNEDPRFTPFSLYGLCPVRGIAWHDMQALIQRPPADFADEQATVDETDVYAVLKFIDEQLKDKAWGVQCGQFISMKLLGLIYKISLQATTIQEALHYLQSYQVLPCRL